MEIQIRRATISDAAVIRDLAERTFRATYAPYNPADLMEEYVAESFTLDKMHEELVGDGEYFFLATADDVVCGYAKLRAGLPPAGVVARRPVELERIYVDAVYHGTGVGRLLMKTAVSYARAAGFDAIWLGVWDRNERAVAFYRKWGFSVSGSKIFQFGSDPQTDILMTAEIGQLGAI